MITEFPAYVAAVIKALRENGFAAYAVGGCVRDALLNKTPSDWDICTSALPEETAAVFSSYKLRLDGAKHGTVTVRSDGKETEITTFRTESGYTDRRHPDKVTFVRNLTEDLARRDFTINAMAYTPEDGLIDPFGGEADLRRGLLRCVGSPEERFTEDALRILRGMRFAARLGFTLEDATAAAMLSKAELLRTISRERITAELRGLLAGDHAVAVLTRFPEIFAVILPQLQPLNPGWTQAAYAVKSVVGLLKSTQPPPDERASFIPALAVLCAARGLPSAAFLELSASLRLSNQESKTVILLAENAPFSRYAPFTVSDARRLLSKLDLPLTLTLETLWLSLANAAEHPAILTAGRLIRALYASEGRITPASLAVKGQDLIAAGVPEGPQVGKALAMLYEKVITGALPNERSALLTSAIKPDTV